MEHQTRSSLIDIIGEDNLCDRCQGSGCRASLSGFTRNKIIVDADKAIDSKTRGSKRCDCILFDQCDGNSVLVVIPMELKSGQWDPEDVVQQLQAGAEYVNAVMRQLSSVRPVSATYVPVLVHKGKAQRKATAKYFLKNQIKFKSAKQQVVMKMIQTSKCGVEGDVAKHATTS